LIHLVSIRLKNIDPDNAVDVVACDNPRDIQRLKLIGEELDNDTGRSVFDAVYRGVETISEIAVELNLTVQLVSYHIEKLLLAGLIEERRDSHWISEKGREVKHYSPSKIAILIVPSLGSLRKDIEAKDRMRKALSNLGKRILPSVAVGLVVFGLAGVLLGVLNGAYFSLVLSGLTSFLKGGGSTNPAAAVSNAQKTASNTTTAAGSAAQSVTTMVPTVSSPPSFSPATSSLTNGLTFGPLGAAASSTSASIASVFTDLFVVAVSVICAYLVYKWLSRKTS
jgi:DNA-binding transcriptional ArsR family regulator